MELQEAANQIDEPVTLRDDTEVDTSTNTEETTGQEEADSNLDDLAKEALGTVEEGSEPIEVEYDGKKYTVDPALKDALLRQADYTRKTMDLAEQRKAYQAERESFEGRVNQTKEMARAYNRLDSLDAYISDLTKMSVEGWSEEQINEAANRLRQMQSERSQLAGAISHAEQEAKQRSEQDFAKQREVCLREAGAKVPNFTDERRVALEKFAQDMGVDKAEAESIVSPVGYEILHYADIGRKFIERQRNAANIKAAGKGAPAKTVGSSANGSKAPEEMSFEEFAKWRESGGS